MILSGGRIWTMDPAMPHAAALPITRQGRVAKGVEAWEGDASQVSNERVDLGGRTVIPGLVDAHVHFRSLALDEARVDLAGCRSPRACAEALAAAGGPFPIGRGLRPDAAGGLPDAALLDEVCGDRPVALLTHDRHTLVLSSRAQERLGAPAPGGVLREHDAWAVRLPEPTAAEALAAVDAAQRRAHARGVTAVHDFEARGGLAIWQALHADRSLTLRVLASLRADRLGAIRETELATGFGDDQLRIGHVKAFADGTLGSRTAWMLEPYADGGTGLPLADADALAALVAEAAAGGLAVAVHAIGDAANRAALDAFARTREAWRALPAPPRIEHAQLVAPADRRRFAELGVVASVQPVHATSDREIADAAWGARAAEAYAWRALADAGAVLAIGSDAPIEPLDPLAAIVAAVRRTDDERPPWHPHQALSAREALAAATLGASIAAGWQRTVGTLAPGRLADLVVLDGDPLSCPPEELGTIRVVATMVGGRWVHGRPPW